MLIVYDCPYKGEDHEWSVETVSGDFDSHGCGKMTQRRCHKCGTVEYIKFVGQDGAVNDIEATLKSAGFRQGR